MRIFRTACVLLLAVSACANRTPPPRHGGYRRPGGTADGGGGHALFLSPMGEPYRGPGGRAAQARAWFDRADANHDGRITLAEMQADALRFFATLDTNGDGEIAPDEIDRYEREVAPEIRVGGGFGGGRGEGMGRSGGRGSGRGGGGGGGMGGGRGNRDEADASSSGNGPTEPELQGAGRFSYLADPEPVASADADFNRGVSRAEFAAAAARRFLLLDTLHEGALRFDTLPPLPGRGARGPGGR